MLSIVKEFKTSFSNKHFFYIEYLNHIVKNFRSTIKTRCARTIKEYSDNYLFYTNRENRVFTKICQTYKRTDWHLGLYSCFGVFILVFHLTWPNGQTNVQTDPSYRLAAILLKHIDLYLFTYKLRVQSFLQ